MLLSNILLSVAMQGFNPFQLDKGIFSGGFQGILYPNPTTLVYPGFDPYSYLESQMSTFTPSTSYVGLGVGNPGIDYKNAGHILGLFDTFARMSYGIGSWKAIYDGDTNIGGPAISFTLPLFNEAFESSPISFGDIYPKFTELPNKWIDTFSINTLGVISPQSHSTNVALIGPTDLNNLFANKSVLSYIGMPQFFRTVINSLVASAGTLATRSEISFNLDDVDQWKPFNGNNSMVVTLDSRSIVIEAGTAYVHCAVSDASTALKTLTGSSAYHDGADNQNDFRSLTELNSVINILPVQMVGGRYITDTHSPSDVSIGGAPLAPVFEDQTPRNVIASSFMILDFIINVSDIPSIAGGPGTITVDGEATVLNAIADTSSFDFFQQERGEGSTDGTPFGIIAGELFQRYFGPVESVKKNIKVEIKNSSSFSWDKDWLGVGGAVDDLEVVEEEEIKGVGGDVQNEAASLVRTDNDPWITPFNKTFTLGPGCNSIRMRVAVDNFMTIGLAPGLPPDFFPLELFWVPEEACHNHGFPLLGIDPEFHCHFPKGVNFNNWVNDPDSARADVPEDTIAVSFTVTGSNIDQMSFEFFV